MNEAIKLAIEKGGYGLFGEKLTDKYVEYGFTKQHLWVSYVRLVNQGGSSKYDKTYNYYKYPEIFFDPEFWRCLGKALGKEHSQHIACPVCGNGYDGYAWWKFHWHRFIDHLAENKDPEIFFINLLK